MSRKVRSQGEIRTGETSPASVYMELFMPPSLVPRPHGKVNSLGTLLFQICSAINEIHLFLHT